MISVCMITKNEKNNILKCLECIVNYGFEIVVVDTGSDDGTIELVENYAEKHENVKLYHFEWVNDFAKAKNEAISKAHGEYVFVLDADEFVQHINVTELEQQIKEHPDMVGRVKRKNVFTKDETRKENQEWLNRIFARSEYRYEGRIHEQVVKQDNSEYETYLTSVSILHTGYDLNDEERSRKALRNLTLLREELESLLKECGCKDVSCFDGIKPKEGSAEAKIPYIVYQLGKSCFFVKDYEKAIQYFSEGLSFDLDPKLEYVIDMVETYGYALINAGRAKDALFLESIYDEFGNCADFKFLMGLVYMNNERFNDAVEEFLKATKYEECRNAGTNSFAAYYNIGVIYECLGSTEQANAYYKKCGDYKPAKERLKQIWS